MSQAAEVERRTTHPITVTVNGTPRPAEVEPRLLLVHFLRETLSLTGTHIGCDTTSCGACTVLAAMAAGREVGTVEGMERNGVLDPVQEGFMQEHGLQCGFCTPAMMLTARALLDDNPDPTSHQIREAICGTACRCTGYETIVRAIRWAAEHPLGAVSETASI